MTELKVGKEANTHQCDCTLLGVSRAARRTVFSGHWRSINSWTRKHSALRPITSKHSCSNTQKNMFYIVRAQRGNSFRVLLSCLSSPRCTECSLNTIKRTTASSSFAQFWKGTRRCLPLSHTTFPRLETGSHSTKFPLRDGGLSLCISFWKFNAFRTWNSEH